MRLRLAGASWDNPLRHIAALATPADYVLFKLDIDNVEVEEGIVRGLLADPALLALVDEFYWEHHVNFAPMNSADCVRTTRGNPADCPGWKTHNSPQTMNDSLTLFAALRHAGVRAHSWT